MHHTFLHTTKIILASFALVLFVVALASLGGLPAGSAQAAAGDDVNGYAWSDNIGWISFDDGNVNVDEVTGAFSGYAWSDNIGWINFAPEASGAPESPKTGVFVDLAAEGDPKPVTGWARACSVFSVPGSCVGLLKSETARGGWDGWIKMSGSWTDGVTLDTTTNTFSGYAWGDIIFGWIDMKGVTYGGAPAVAEATLSVTLTPETQSVESETNANITWQVSNATDGCTDTPTGWWKKSDGTAITLNASGDGSGTVSVGPITEPSAYSLECSDSSGSVSDSANVNVNPFIKSFVACNGANCGTSTTILNEGAVYFKWITANYESGDVCTLARNDGSAVTVSSGSAIDCTAESPCTASDSITLGGGSSETHRYTLTCAPDEKTATVYVRPYDFILEANPTNIRVTSVGRIGDATAVGTGGVSDKTTIIAITSAAYNNTITLFVNDNSAYAATLGLDPFLLYDHTYHFQLVPLETDSTPPSETTGQGNLPQGRYLYGIKFWIESAEPLPAVSDTPITVVGDPTPASSNSGDERTVQVHLNSRLFDPQYKEI